MSDKACWWLNQVMRAGCNAKIFPYDWDPVAFRFSLSSNWGHAVLHNFHALVMLSMSLFGGTRFLLTMMRGTEFPARVRVMNILWTLAYTLSTICFLQFRLYRGQIMHFGNALFAFVQRSKRERSRLSNANILRRFGKDRISKLAIMSAVMLSINPSFHSVMMIDTPCSPNFSSSVWLSCGSTTEDTNPFLDKVPFIFLETYFAVLMFFPWTFNWIMIYMGLAWVQEEVNRLRAQDWTHEGWPSKVAAKYRSLQCITVLLNSAFRLYLEWFPTILLGIVALLLFACIKFWGIGWRAYLMFPSCTIRCTFESFTILSIAGALNKAGGRLLAKWKARTKLLRTRAGAKALEAFQRSCKILTCAAGHLYSFENSIVLITLNNCVQLTLNLLLVKFKHN